MRACTQHADAPQSNARSTTLSSVKHITRAVSQNPPGADDEFERAITEADNFALDDHVQTGGGTLDEASWQHGTQACGAGPCCSVVRSVSTLGPYTVA